MQAGRRRGGAGRLKGREAGEGPRSPQVTGPGSAEACCCSPSSRRPRQASAPRATFTCPGARRGRGKGRWRGRLAGRLRLTSSTWEGGGARGAPSRGNPISPCKLNRLPARLHPGSALSLFSSLSARLLPRSSTTFPSAKARAGGE